MIAKITTALTTVAATAVALTGCGSGSTLGMASEESIAAVRTLVATHVDTSQYRIYQVEWLEDRRERKLENILSCIEVYYTDRENSDYNLTITLENGKFVAGEPLKHSRKMYSYDCSTPLDPSRLDAAYIRTIVEAATALVAGQSDGDAYELRSVEKFRFRIEPVDLDRVARWRRDAAYRKEHERLDVSFALNYTKKDEQTEYRGRSAITNYYTVPFTADEAGAVSFDD